MPYKITLLKDDRQGTGQTVAGTREVDAENLAAVCDFLAGIWVSEKRSFEVHWE